jgi:hypothetical protein
VELRGVESLLRGGTALHVAVVGRPATCNEQVEPVKVLVCVPPIRSLIDPTLD